MDYPVLTEKEVLFLKCEWYKQLPQIYHVLRQENSSVLFIGSPHLLCVQEPIFYLPAILSSSHLVLSAVLAFEKGWEILADNTGAKRKQRKLLTKIKLQLCSCRATLGACSALSLCRDVTSLERTRRIIQTPSLETRRKRKSFSIYANGNF